MTFATVRNPPLNVIGAGSFRHGVGIPKKKNIRGGFISASKSFLNPPIKVIDERSLRDTKNKKKI